MLRNIIDYQFNQYTFKYFVGLWLLFLGTYLIPFLIQIFTDNWGVVLVCNLICIASQIFFYGIEYIQFKESGKEYLNETWNRLDMTMFVINGFYFFIRMSHLDSSFSPLYTAADKDSEDYVPIILMNLVLVVFAIFRMMYYLRAFESFG